MSTESEMKQPTTKTCQQCRTWIDPRARICPTCGSKQKEKGLWLVALFALGFILIVGGANSGGKSKSTSTPSIPIQSTAESTVSREEKDKVYKPYRECMLELNQYWKSLPQSVAQGEIQECRKLIPAGY
jgi:hypothetical protein